MTTTDLPADGCSEFIGKNCGRRDATSAAQPQEAVPEGPHELRPNGLARNAGYTVVEGRQNPLPVRPDGLRERMPSRV
jgi:hypothetical protein